MLWPLGKWLVLTPHQVFLLLDCKHTRKFGHGSTFNTKFLSIVFLSQLKCHSTLNDPMFELTREYPTFCAPLNFRNFVWPRVQMRISYDSLATIHNTITFISCFD